MINCFTQTTAHLLRIPNALKEQYEFRHNIFIKEKKWKEISEYREMEFDQYDTPVAKYFTWHDEKEKVKGLMRLVSTDYPYMLEEIFPDMFTKYTLPKSPNTGELTRFAIDPELPESLREKINAEILIACLEYGINNNYENYLSLTPVSLFPKIKKLGCKLEITGKSKYFDGIKCNSVRYDVSEEVLNAVRKNSTIWYPVLNDVACKQHTKKSSPDRSTDYEHVKEKDIIASLLPQRPYYNNQNMALIQNEFGVREI